MSRAPLLAALTGVAVLVTGGALLAVPGPPAGGDADRPPTTVALTRQQLLCPAGTGSITSTRASGPVGVGLDGSAPTSVRRYAAAAVDPATAYVVDGRRALAPGLVATVADARAGAATACLPPAPDYWFTGAGAASIHASALQLVNPDRSPAVAEIELLGPDGPVDAGPIRSVTVPGRSAATVDLAARVPTRAELAVHVTVARGRLGATMADTLTGTLTNLAAGSTDWLPAQVAPARTSVLAGLPAATGDAVRRLVLANPGDDQTAVELRVVDRRSTFTPNGVEPIEVPAGSTVSTALPPAVARALAGGRAGLQVTADQPVTATVRSRTGGDLSHAVAAAPVTEAALLVPALPDGRATLALAAPETAAAAVVTSYDAAGRRLRQQRVAVRRLTGAQVALPRRVALLVVRTSGPALVGAVRVTAGPRVATLPLTQLVTTGLVPDVAPALPG